MSLSLAAAVLAFLAVQRGLAAKRMVIIDIYIYIYILEPATASQLCPEPDRLRWM